jgi:hypothetical protein
MKKSLVSLIILSVLSIYSYAQVGIGVKIPHSSAMLEVVSTSKGTLLTRMTQIQRLAIKKPAIGLLVYQTDAVEGFYYFSKAGWQMLNGGSGGGTSYMFTSPLILNGSTVSILQANATTNGFLSSTDWNTFNNKVNSNPQITAGTKTKITFDSKGLVTAGADATTSDIAEGTNLYFTDTRARSSISLTTTGSNQAATYNSQTGVLNIPDNSSSIFSFEFPEGIDGQFVTFSLNESTSYTVPNGYNLYVTYGIGGPVSVNGISFGHYDPNNFPFFCTLSGLIFPENSVIQYHPGSELGTASGILVPKTNKIEVVNIPFTLFPFIYEVPQGKTLILKGVQAEFYINDFPGSTPGMGLNGIHFIHSGSKIFQNLTLGLNLGLSGYLINN